MSARLEWPELEPDRGVGYWLRPGNLIAGRRNLRSDHSNEWRYESLRTSSPPPPPMACDPDPDARSRTVAWLTDRPAGGRFRCVILGDTGEGDYSQIATLPVIRALEPDFLIINGDVAYPAGTDSDYREGFFQPYRGLGIPIWAVPGNHDYYSAQRGREFHEIFCTELRRAEWEDAGLPLKPQPGTYWELCDHGGGHPLVILGADTGHSADLEGTKGRGFLGLGRKQPRDTAQYEWLEWRLRRAQQDGARVVVLFHIPALVGEEHLKKIRLDTLYRLVAQYSSVCLVVTAHEHNYQRYAPDVFGKYLQREYGAAAADPPTYLVSGAGGAYLTSTDFDRGKKTGYVTLSRYPTAADWRQWAPLGIRAVAKAGLGKTLVNLITMGLVSLKPGIAEESDADRPERLSMLLLDHDPAAGTTVQPVFVDDLATMYQHLPPGTPVRVQEGEPRLDPAAIAGCCREPAIAF